MGLDLTTKGSTLPHNKRIEPIALGRHALCVLWVYSMRISKGHAGDTTAMALPGQGLRPCSRLIRALCGLRIDEMKAKSGCFQREALIQRQAADVWPQAIDN